VVGGGCGTEGRELLGIVSIEGFAPYDKDLVGGGKIWRPVAKSQDQLAIDGLKFLKSLFG